MKIIRILVAVFMISVYSSFCSLKESPSPLNVAFLVSSNESNVSAVLRYFNQPEKQGIIKPCVVISNNKNVCDSLDNVGDIPVEYVPCQIKKGMSWDEKKPLRMQHAQELITCLEKHGITPENGLICCSGFRLLLAKELLDHYPNQVLNLHPSLLPAFPGLNVIQKALDRGVKVTGVTIHFIDEGMDTGKIIAQKVVDVTSEDTLETLSEKLQKAGDYLYPRVIEHFC